MDECKCGFSTDDENEMFEHKRRCPEAEIESDEFGEAIVEHDYLYEVGEDDDPAETYGQDPYEN
jgi:hypothetical protein